MIIAYASGLPNPTVSQTNAQIDLQGGAVLPTTQALYGAGVDTNDAGASFSFSWTLLRKPTGSAAALNSTTVASPTLENIDIWGNYLLFLIVTNSGTGETSETDPLRAPNSAFTAVEVLGEQLQLQKPAAGQRDWNAKAWDWVEAIEDNKETGDDHETRITTLENLSTNFALDDLVDVTITAPSSGDMVTFNGVDWTNVPSDKSLDDLTDVTLTPSSQGEALVYNGADWVNAELNLNDLGDVTLGTLSSGQVLRYDGAAWANDADSDTLSLNDEYGITQQTVDLRTEGLTVFNDDANLEVTLGTLAGFGNPSVKVNLAQNVTVANDLSVNNNITVNADNDSTDAVIYFNRGDFVLPRIGYDQSQGTFFLVRDNIGGDEVIMTQDDVPTTTVRGGVRLSNNSYTSYNTSGFIPRVERLIYTMATSQTVDYKSSGQNNVTTPDNQVCAYDNTSVSQPPVLMFKNTTGGSIAATQISVILASAGISTTTEYAFKLVSYSSLANVSSDTRTVDLGLPTFNRLGDNEVGSTEFDYVTHNAGTPVEILAGHYFGILVVTEPDHCGNLIQVTLEAIKLL